MKPASSFRGWLILLLLGRLSLVSVDPGSWQPSTPEPSRVISLPSVSLKRSGRVNVRGVHGSSPMHLVLLAGSRRLKVYDQRGALVFTCRATTKAVNAGYGHYGSCPLGLYSLGKNVVANSPAFGRYAIKLCDLDKRGMLHRYHRSGIFLHGGGSTLRYPFAAHQPLIRTHGCIRVHNADLTEIVRINHRVRARGSYLTLSIQET